MSKRISKIIPSFLVDKASCTRQFESELSLHSLASLFPIKKGIFSNPSVSLSKGSSTSNQAFLLRRKDVTALRCSEPLRSKVGGPSKVYARFCGMGPPDYDLYHIFYMLCSESHYLSVNDFLSKFVQSSFIPILYNLLFLCI